MADEPTIPGSPGPTNEAPSQAETPAAPAPPESWPVLGPIERRILGVLIEKAKTVPDQYPMTRNALLNGCNQKNNRDPVMQLTDAELDTPLAELKRLGYVQQITGSGRTDKFRHVLYDVWRVDKVQLAILGELLLRGRQTEGELRGRASRMEPIPDLDTLRQQLRLLAERGLVVPLEPIGKRGATVMHGFCSEEELARLRGQGRADTTPAKGVPGRTPARTDPAILEQVRSLKAGLEEIRRELQRLKEDLTAAPPGEPIRGRLEQLTARVETLFSETDQLSGSGAAEASTAAPSEESAS